MIDKYERIAKKRDKRLKAVSKGRQKGAQAQIAMIEKYERVAKRVMDLKAKLRQLRNEAAEENARMTLLPKKPCVKSLKVKQEPRDGSGSEQESESWRGGQKKDPNGADWATTGSAARGTSQGPSTSY